MQFTEHLYHKQRPRYGQFSEDVYFVQICAVFAGPVTYYDDLIFHTNCSYNVHVLSPLHVAYTK